MPQQFVAFCDADSFYPPQYLSRCQAIYADTHVHAALAVDLFEEADLFASRLRRAGGFSGRRWPFVLEDHEIIHRICRAGRCATPMGIGAANPRAGASGGM